MRVLVTGGAGFIGRPIVERLAAQGHDVVVVDVLHPAAHRGVPTDLPAGVVPTVLEKPAMPLIIDTTAAVARALAAPVGAPPLAQGAIETTVMSLSADASMGTPITVCHFFVRAARSTA